MTVRTFARTIAIAAVFCCGTLFPQEAAAQCAVSYTDTSVSGDYVYTDASVGDYYGSEPCGGFGVPWFFHEYSVSIQITCGTQQGAEQVSSAVDYGGGWLPAGVGVTPTESTLCQIEVFMSIWCSALYEPILEAWEYQEVAVNSCSLTAKFSGGLTSGNSLSFAPASYVCGGDNLGVADCSTVWVGKVEISGTVSDDASLWTPKQSYTGRRLRILGTGSETDDTLNVSDDDPDSAFVQNSSGQAKTFWLDAPGHTKTVGGQTVTSLYQVQNFTSRLEKGAFSCEVQWHLKLMVAGGDLLGSEFGSGHISTE